nr:ribonuclease H-like domain-containing protein [Tanacetum cinerariifolium]
MAHAHNCMEKQKQGSKVEEQAPKALMAIDGVGWDWSFMANEEENHALIDDEEAPTEFALMAISSSNNETVLPEFADDTITDYTRPSPSVESNPNDLQNSSSSAFENEESTGSILSKPEIKFVKPADSPTVAKTNKVETVRKSTIKYDELYRKTSKRSNVRGLTQVEARLVEYKSQEIKFCEKIRAIEFELNNKNIKIERLTNELEDAKKENDVLDSKVTDAKKEKDVLDSKVTVLFPPHAQVYSPLKKDMSWTGLPEFADDIITDYTRSSPSVESNPNDLQNSSSSASENGESTGSILSKPEIKFIKPADSPTVAKTNKVETVRKSTIKYAELYIKTSKRSNDSGCSRHMTGNISYLTDYEPYDGGYVSFGQGGCKITGKGTIKTECIVLGRNFKLTDDTNVLLRTPRQHNMYTIDLNNVVPHKDLTCLVAKASADKCMLWHGRLCHLNIKTMNRIQSFQLECIKWRKQCMDFIRLLEPDGNVADLLTKPFDAGRFQYLVIVDFVEASHLRYALTINPTVYVSHIRQFWSTARIETTNEETKILATVDGKLRTIFESSIRRNIKLRDEAGISSLPDAKLFKNLTLMGYNILPNQKFSFQKGQFSHQWKYLIHTIMQCLSPKSTGFNEFSSNIATALVCLATNRVYNFSKMIFDGKGSGTPTEPHHTPSPEAQQTSPTTHSSPSLPPQDEMASKITAQDLEISQLKARVRLLEDIKGGGIAQSREDAPIKGRSLDEGEEAAIERKVATVSIPPATISVPTGSDVVPTASPIFTTATKSIPYARRKGSKEGGERFKRKRLRLEQESAKKVKTSEEVSKEVHEENLKEIMQLIPVEEVYVEALQVKHPIIDWELWALVKETFNIRPATNDKENELWVELKRLYEPNVEDQLWTHTQNLMHAPLEWKLYDTYGVHHVISNDKEMFMLVEKDYHLRKGLAIVMISYKLQGRIVRNKMLKAFSLPVMSSHYQKKFPVLVRKVPPGEEKRCHCCEDCTAIEDRESIPYARRKGKEKMVESETPKKKKIQEQIDVQMARKLEEEMESDAQRMNEQIARDAKIARIHVEEKLQIMIDGFDMNNETVAKYLQEYHQFAEELSIGRRIELISSKEGGERFKRKRLRLEQESAKKVKTSEEVSKEVHEENLKEIMQLIPVEEVYVEALQVKHPIIDW